MYVYIEVYIYLYNVCASKFVLVASYRNVDANLTSMSADDLNLPSKIFKVYVCMYPTSRELCRLDMRRESKASTALLSIRKSVVQASLQTVINLISNTYVESFAPDKKTNSDTFNESLSCDLVSSYIYTYACTYIHIIWDIHCMHT